jgi:hypothetical protein
MDADQKYPAGKLNRHDEGALGVMCFIESNRVVIDFGKSLTWFALTKSGAEAFIKTLQAQADKLTNDV